MKQKLLDATKALCDDFARKADLETILSHFSSTEPCIAREHGQMEFAPFLGRTFRGQDGVREYFSLIALLLIYDEMSFGDYVVDTEVRKVSARGRARFTWISTQESWDETFVYVLALDDDNKVYRYEVWADTGAAYLARKGKLGEVISRTQRPPQEPMVLRE